MTYQTVDEARAALSSVGSTKADIIAFVKQLSVQVSGTTTVL